MDTKKTRNVCMALAQKLKRTRKSFSIMGAGRPPDTQLLDPHVLDQVRADAVLSESNSFTPEDSRMATCVDYIVELHTTPAKRPRNPSPFGIRKMGRRTGVGESEDFKKHTDRFI